MAIAISEVEDSSGTTVFSPEACSHTYTYDSNGNLTVDTAYDSVQGKTYVKTYTYTSGKLTAETAWVKQ